jgi:hypothetical protein
MTAVLLCKKCCIVFNSNKEYKNHPCEPFNVYIDWNKPDCITSIVNEMNKKDQEMNDLTNKLKCEYFKSKLFAKVAEKYSGIDMKDFLKEKPERIDIYPNTKFNVVVHHPQPAQPIEQTQPVNEDKERKRKEHFISVKHITDISPEQTVDERQKNIKDKINTVSSETVTKDITTLLETLNKTNFNDSVKKLKQFRKKLIPNLTHDTYIKLLREHYTITESAVKNETSKRKESYMEKSFSPLEHRLLLSPCNHLFNIEPSDIELYHCLIPEEATYSEWVPFNREKYFKQCLTYDLAFSHIQDIVKRTLFNKFGYNNVVYIPIKKTEEKYTYYYLDRVDGGKRFWKMDYKLENLTDRFCEIAVDRIIFYFRQLYSCVFRDNTFRHDFLKKAPCIELEFQQLIQNINLLSDRNGMYKMFQSLVDENAEFKPMDNDRVNQYTGDKITRKILPFDDLKTIQLENIAHLFENPNQDDIKNFVSSHVNKY